MFTEAEDIAVVFVTSFDLKVEFDGQIPCARTNIIKSAFCLVETRPVVKRSFHAKLSVLNFTRIVHFLRIAQGNVTCFRNQESDFGACIVNEPQPFLLSLRNSTSRMWHQRTGQRERIISHSKPP